MVKLSVNLRQEIVKMFQTGKNQSNFSRALNIGRTTVRKVWLKFQGTGSVSDKKRSGRPKILSERQTRLLTRTSRKDPFRTSRECYRTVELIQVPQYRL